MRFKGNPPRTLLTVLITALITGSLVWATMRYTAPHTGGHPAEDTAGPPETRANDPGERKILYWQAPMDPMEIYDEPGKSKMGMDLVPVYEDEVAGRAETGERKIVYWKAPMDPTEIYDAPGKSKMGMDLVPVYEDELVGGVDIKISPVVEQNMGLRTEPVRHGPLQHTIHTYGHITFDETRVGVVSSKTDGWIEKLYAGYTGFFIEKGAPLFEIYSPSLLAAQEEYLSASRNYRTRQTLLNKEILASAKKRLTYFDIAERDILDIRKKDRVEKTVIIRSPFTGVITDKNAVQGDFVKAGADLFTITDLSRVWVEAHIFEYEQKFVSIGQEVEMTLSYHPEKTYTGKIFYIFPYLQPQTRDVIVRIGFENQNHALKPDMYARIKIRTDPMDNGLSIPSQAVIHSGEKKIVFVPNGNGVYTPREVRTGRTLDAGRVEILTGLTREDRVVVSGQFLLDSESKLKEAIQKMMELKSAPNENTDDADDFFDDMDFEDDFFKDMDT